MGKILLATDFTQTSIKAYSFASNLAIKTESIIVLVHILPYLISKYHIRAGLMPIEESLEKEVNHSKKILEEHASNQIFAKNNLSTLNITESNNNVIETLNQIVEEQDISTIIIGTDGIRSNHKSLASTLVKLSLVPVIAIGDSITTKEIKNITLATNFENVNYKYLDQIWNIQQAYNSHINILYINTPGNFKDSEVIEKEYNLFINQYELGNTSLHIYNSHLVEEGILKFANKNDTDLLAISTHGRRGLNDFVHKSYSPYIVGHAKQPVFVYNMYNDKIYHNTITNTTIGNFYA